MIIAEDKANVTGEKQPLLTKLVEMIRRGDNLNDLFSLACKLSVSLNSFCTSFVATTDLAEGAVVEEISGDPCNLKKGLVSSSLGRWVMVHGLPFATQRLSAHCGLREFFPPERYGGLVCYPIFLNERAAGFLAALSPTSSSILPGDRENISTMAELLSLAMHLKTNEAKEVKLKNVLVSFGHVFDMVNSDANLQEILDFISATIGSILSPHRFSLEIKFHQNNYVFKYDNTGEVLLKSMIFSEDYPLYLKSSEGNLKVFFVKGKSADDGMMISIFLTLVAFAVNNKLKNPNSLVAKMIINLVSSLNEPLSRHLIRVGKLSSQLALHMGLSKEQVETVKIAGYLHHFELAFPRQNSVLTPERFASRVLGSLLDNNQVLEIVEAYHQQFAGDASQPRGEHASIEVKIVLLSCAYDEACHSGPRKKITFALLEEKFDPQLILLLKKIAGGDTLVPPVNKLDLTKREKEILTLISEGLSNVEIADQLFITKLTVKKHLSNLSKKIGVSDRTKLAIWARSYSN